MDFKKTVTFKILVYYVGKLTKTEQYIVGIQTVAIFLYLENSIVCQKKIFIHCIDIN